MARKGKVSMGCAWNWKPMRTRHDRRVLNPIGRIGRSELVLTREPKVRPRKIPRQKPFDDHLPADKQYRSQPLHVNQGGTTASLLLRNDKGPNPLSALVTTTPMAAAFANLAMPLDPPTPSPFINIAARGSPDERLNRCRANRQ